MYSRGDRTAGRGSDGRAAGSGIPRGGTAEQPTDGPTAGGLLQEDARWATSGSAYTVEAKTLTGFCCYGLFLIYRSQFLKTIHTCRCIWFFFNIAEKTIVLGALCLKTVTIIHCNIIRYLTNASVYMPCYTLTCPFQTTVIRWNERYWVKKIKRAYFL